MALCPYSMESRGFSQSVVQRELDANTPGVCTRFIGMIWLVVAEVMELAKAKNMQ